MTDKRTQKGLVLGPFFLIKKIQSLTLQQFDITQLLLLIQMTKTSLKVDSIHFAFSLLCRVSMTRAAFSRPHRCEWLLRWSFCCWQCEQRVGHTRPGIRDGSGTGPFRPSILELEVAVFEVGVCRTSPEKLCSLGCPEKKVKFYFKLSATKLGKTALMFKVISLSQNVS